MPHWDYCLWYLLYLPCCHTFGHFAHNLVQVQYLSSVGYPAYQRCSNQYHMNKSTVIGNSKGIGIMFICNCCSLSIIKMMDQSGR